MNKRKVLFPVVVLLLVLLAAREIYAMRQATYYAGGSSSSSYGTYSTYYQQTSTENPEGCLTREEVSPDRRALGAFCQSASVIPVGGKGLYAPPNFISNLEQTTGLRWWVLGLMALTALLVVLAFLGGMIIGRRQAATSSSSSGKDSGTMPSISN